MITGSRTARRVLLLVPIFLALAACSGGEDDGSDAAPVTLGKTGPGDAGDHFPMQVGNVWQFAGTSRYSIIRRPRIPEAGNRRFDLKAGGELVLVRIHPRGREDRGWEAALQGAFHGQFDIERQLDNLGWDGWYGFLVAAAPIHHLSVRLGWLHDSSHVGNEYAERTGRRRIGYTRQEWIAGSSWLTGRGLRLTGSSATRRR